MIQLPKGVENSIPMAFVSACADRIRKRICFFLLLFLPGSAISKGQNAYGWAKGTFDCLKHKNHWPLDNHALELPTPCSLAELDPACGSFFQESLLRPKRIDTSSHLPNHFKASGAVSASV